MINRLLLVVCCISLADGVDAQNCASHDRPEIPAPVRLVTISNGSLLSPEKQEEIAKMCRERRVHPDTLDREINSLADELSERVRAAYQNEGYFKVEVTARALKTADERVYDLEAQVRSVGEQYRLGEIRFVRAAAFSGAQLRAQFPVERGEIFSRVKVAEGLEQLRRLYLSEGYVNYTGVPGTMFDDDKDVANLTMEIDEGKQFRLRRVEILGVDAETQARMPSQLPIRPGEVYDADVFEKAVSRFQNTDENPNRSASAVKPDLRLDQRSGTLDVWLDLRQPAACPAGQ